MYFIAIISQNLIFFKLLQSLLCKKIPDCKIIRFSSFHQVREEIGEYNFDLIIADGIISGAASFEIINYIRLERRIVCPVYFFSEVHTGDFKLKAFETGVNYYYEKPFDPLVVSNEISAHLTELKLERI